MKRVYTLYRVSTKGQVDKDDIPMQKTACHEFAGRQDGWIISKEFYEKGISGYNYVLAVYKLSESGVTASVDASGTNISGVQASVSGTTLTVSVPTANLNGSGNWKVKLTKTATANVETMLAYQISGNTANQRLVMLDTIAVKKNLSNYVSGTFQNEGVIEVYKKGTGGEKLALLTVMSYEEPAEKRWLTSSSKSTTGYTKTKP